MATARRMLLGLAMWLGTLAQAQTFSLQVENDSLAYLVLRTDSTTDRWRLAFPVYQICTGDVDGDGQEDALVGVVKSTRFDKKAARRHPARLQNRQRQGMHIASHYRRTIRGARARMAEIRTRRTAFHRKRRASRGGTTGVRTPIGALYAPLLFQPTNANNHSKPHNYEKNHSFPYDADHHYWIVGTG